MNLETSRLLGSDPRRGGDEGETLVPIWMYDEWGSVFAWLHVPELTNIGARHRCKSWWLTRGRDLKKEVDCTIACGLKPSARAAPARTCSKPNTIASNPKCRSVQAAALPAFPALQMSVRSYLGSRMRWHQSASSLLWMSSPCPAQVA